MQNQFVKQNRDLPSVDAPPLSPPGTLGALLEVSWSSWFRWGSAQERKDWIRPADLSPSVWGVKAEGVCVCLVGGAVGGFQCL